MAEFTVDVSRKVGCLDSVVARLGREDVQIESVACACAAKGSAVASFSVSDPARLEGVKEFSRGAGESAVLHVAVANERGCLAKVTDSLTLAGVEISSLSCACSAADKAGVVAVGLARSAR